MSWTWEHDDDEGFDGHDHDDEDDAPPPPVRGLGYVCSSCGNPAPCDSEHLVDSPDRDDANIPPDEKLMRLLCDKCLAIKRQSEQMRRSRA
jgi:hypothetical protein